MSVRIDPPPATAAGCASCSVANVATLRKLGISMDDADFVVALAGNPNVGKSTVFNALTGLRQHTGNWPGKTVARAEGGFEYADRRYKIVDLPGTYSLLSTSLDEEIARNFILFGRPDVTVVVVDATRLERNLNLVLQVLEITDRAVVCLNLVDEARRLKLNVDERRLARDLGVPVVPTVGPPGRGAAAPPPDDRRGGDRQDRLPAAAPPERAGGAQGRGGRADRADSPGVPRAAERAVGGAAPVGWR